MIRLALIMPCWGRPALTSIVLDYYARLRIPSVTLFPFVGLSPEDPHYEALKESADLSAWLSISVPNDPLGTKWNAIAHEARKYAPDAVMIVGSDDLINVKWFEVARDEIHRNAHYVEMRGCYFMDARTGKVVYAETERVGAGRVLTNYLMEKVDWAPFEPECNINLDGSLYWTFGIPGFALRKLGEYRPALVHPVYVKARDVDAVCLDVKVRSLESESRELGMWSFEAMSTRLTCSTEPKDFLDRHFPAQADALRSLRVAA